MATSDLVTITFPVYDRTTYFEEALLSAIHQTVQVPIIVVDNASPHNRFKEICNKYDKTYNIKYYRNDSNIGMFPNWNLCFEYATTKYAIIVGDDDVLEANYIEEFIIAHNRNPQIGLYYTNINGLIQQDDNSFSIQKCDWKNLWGVSTIRKIKEVSYQNHMQIPSISCIIDVELQRKQRFETRLHTCNDKQLIYTMPDDTVVFGNSKALYQYRRHHTNDSSNVSCILGLSEYLIQYDLREYAHLSFFEIIKLFQKYYWRCYRQNGRDINKKIIESNSYYTNVYMDMFSTRNLPYRILAAIYFYLHVVVNVLKNVVSSSGCA